MSVEKYISTKIISFDLNDSQFENLIRLLNTEGYKFKLFEEPYLSFIDEKHDLKISLYPKSKVEFMATYKDPKKLDSYKKCIQIFLKNAALFFKALSMELGRIYTNEGNIKNTFIKPEFFDENSLKYKLHTEISYSEKGDILYTTNYHFYNFNNIYNPSGIMGIIQNEFLNKLEDLVFDYEKTFKVDNEN